VWTLRGRTGCGHGSSLSPAMHGMVAARLGRSDLALRYFQRAAAIDLADTSAAIDGGVHIAALGGIWLMAVFGFAGVSLCSDGIAIDPRLPAHWRGVGFRLQWRGRHVKIRIDQDKKQLEATLEAGEPMTVFVNSELHEVQRDQILRLGLGI